MPKVDDVPEQLKPYLVHGLDLQWKSGDKEAVCECPWCGRSKFSVNLETGLWRCWVCAEGTEKGGGNARVFVRVLHRMSYELQQDYSELIADRRLLDAVGLTMWGCCRSLITGEWLIPGYGVDGALNQLYRYSRAGERMVLMPTTSLGQYLFGMEQYDATKPIVDLCEGYWDGVAWWERLAQTKLTDEGFQLTGNIENSLLAERNVLAVPGCSIFREDWTPLFSGKIVNLLYDNDHPGTHPKTGQQTPPGALTNMQRVAGILSSSKEPPKEINFKKWGQDVL